MNTNLRERLLAAAELVEHTDDDGRSAAFVPMHHQDLATLLNQAADALSPPALEGVVPADLIAALVTANRLANFGDAVYGVRERIDWSKTDFKGSSWDHPDTQAYCRAVECIDRYLAGITSEDAAAIQPHTAQGESK